MPRAQLGVLLGGVAVIGVGLAPVAATWYRAPSAALATLDRTASATQSAAKSPIELSFTQRTTTTVTMLTMRARARDDVPANARLVILTRRLGSDAGKPVTRRLTCRVGAQNCVRVVRLAGSGRLRVRALVREGRRVSRLSRPLIVSWQTSSGDGSTGAAPAPVNPATAPETTTAPAPGATPPTTSTPTPPSPPAPPPLAGLPQFTAGFENWTRLNAQPIPPDSAQTARVGTDAHRGIKNVYVNISPEAARTRPFPDGTVVVKAVTRGTSNRLILIATMRKIAGSDPAHGNWKYIEYLPNAQDRFETSAGLQDATCWGCHATATSTDWVFTPTD